MKKKQTMEQLLVHILLILICVISLLPFLSMVSTSFMKVKGVLPNEPIIFPKLPLYTKNYVKVWFSGHFQTYFLNKVIVTAAGVFINMFV